jgi:hypothetical protein
MVMAGITVTGTGRRMRVLDCTKEVYSSSGCLDYDYISMTNVEG